jgi:hypothetical protein
MILPACPVTEAKHALVVLDESPGASPSFNICALCGETNAPDLCKKAGNMSAYDKQERRIDNGRQRKFRLSPTIKRDDPPALTPRSYCSLEVTDEDVALVLKRYSPKPDGKTTKAATEVER